ncbi:uncharacterized protein LOC128271493 [Anopheles cruzii]|uniref:uncharacterized protein LOC128271493 n=1 Tax=Anopheles cruzii TaxID=68878 RepID=UPI0022EC4EDB|nr:uncharacterized protein LOC128271493 [Anopheles cruzii]
MWSVCTIRGRGRAGQALVCSIVTSILAILLQPVNATQYRVDMKTSVVYGPNTTVNIVAVLYTDGALVKDDYIVYWRDNTPLQHRIDDISSQVPRFNWTISFPHSVPSGTYEATVTVKKLWVFVPLDCAKGSVKFNLTSILSGELQLSQNDTLVNSTYIASTLPLNQSVSVLERDRVALEEAAYVRTFWFINCQYIGTSSELSTLGNYTKENETYTIEALVVASFEKLPDPTTTTTTTTTTTPATTTTTTSTTPPTTTTTTSTTPPTTTSTSSTSTTTSTPKPKELSSTEATPGSSGQPLPTGGQRSRRDANPSLRLDSSAEDVLSLKGISPALLGMIDSKNIVRPDGSKELPTDEQSTDSLQVARLEKKSNTKFFLDDAKQPFVCGNSSMVPPDPAKVYGHFQRTVVVQNPIARFNVSGQQWVKQGQPVDLVFQCSGSPPFEFCVNFMPSAHNMTGNETCDHGWEPAIDGICRYKFHRFFFDKKLGSIVFFVRNRISNYITQVGIQFYENQPKSQLSVIIVPIGFCLLAVTLVVFGVAYYIQNRDRFIVEVADFNFGDTSSLDDDMEYKTFHQRLVDSLRDSVRVPRFNFRRSSAHDVDDVSPSGGPDGDSSLRYGSMT